MKLINDAGWRKARPKSIHDVYGATEVSPDSAEYERRAPFSEAIPVSRPRTRFSVARSSGRPSSRLRSVSVTNSSISLPIWYVMPRATEPAA
ncbi:unannotated protein [freshwater metagenome]|uniref:Unannotated protein n=1 Tax=freshwater metagenome TaxID=449393 RepID=A0A6J6ZRS9_9ZZZZ